MLSVILSDSLKSSKHSSRFHGSTINMFFNFPRAKVELTLIARAAERGVFCDENDERVAKAKKNIQDTCVISLELLLKPYRRYPRLSVCTHKHTLLFDDMFPLALLCRIARDFTTRLPSFSLFISPLCARLCEYFSSEPFSKFWQGHFLSWFQKRKM